MSQLKELMAGNGSLDTMCRAISMALFVTVCVALIWTSLSVRRDAFDLSPESLPSFYESSMEHSAIIIRKEIVR